MPVLDLAKCHAGVKWNGAVYQLEGCGEGARQLQPSFRHADRQVGAVTPHSSTGSLHAASPVYYGVVRHIKQTQPSDGLPRSLQDYVRRVHLYGFTESQRFVKAGQSESCSKILSGTTMLDE